MKIRENSRSFLDLLLPLFYNFEEMNDEAEYTFRTKSGVCVVSPDKLTLTREGEAGKAANFLYGKSVRRGLIIYEIIGILALFLGVWQIINQSYILGVILLLLGIYFFWNVIASWNNSGTNMIERSALQSIDIKPPKPPMTRGYFSVNFSYKGKKRRRLIMLPGSMSGGDEEYPKALAALKETGWL